MLDFANKNQHSVDFELAVRDGNLDVGVFGLESMISLERAKLLVDRLAEELESLAAI